VVNYGQNVDAIATFTYFVEGNGNLNSQTPVPRDTIKMAKSKGVRSLALIHNYQNGFNKEIARTLMKSATARQNLINQLLVILPKEGYDGINVDIEGIYPADSGAYINLLKELKTALQAKGYWLTVSIPAKAYHNPQDGWSGGYDYKAIGELADHVLLMTYDYNWMGGTAGPIAPLPWVEKVIKYAISQMPAEKVLMGLATYGYDWSAPKNRALAYPKAVALAYQYGAAIKWNQEFQVPYFNYIDAQGNQHVVWFEDQRSAKAKLQLVTKYNLAGVGIWRLGFEDSLYWDVLKEYRAN
jgi:spore germination protein YaaH